MLIPYFYLKIGKIQILQVQNKKTDFFKTIYLGGEEIEICSRAQPEVSGRTLFINGSHKNGKYKMLDVSCRGEDFVEAINKLNKQQEL